MIIRPSTLIRESFLALGICQPSPFKAWWCTTQWMPDDVGSVDNIVTVSDKDDVTVHRFLSDSSYQIDPHISIVVRSVGIEPGYEKIRTITDFLDMVKDFDVSVDGDEYRIIGTKRTNNIAFGGLDETMRRYTHSIEYDLQLH